MFKVDAGNNQVIVGIGTAFTDTAYGFYARNGAIVGNYSGTGNGFAVYRGAALQTRITHDSTRGFVSTGGNPLHFRTALSGSDFKLSIGTSDVVINENGGDIDELLIARQDELARLDEMSIITDTDPSATKRHGRFWWKG